MMVGMPLADIYKKIKPAVAAIAIVEEHKDGTHFRIFGTGFCVDPNGIVVTARHVITEYYKEWLKAPLPKIGAEGEIDIKEPDFHVIFFRKERGSYGAVHAPPTTYVLPCEGAAPEDDVAVLRMPKCPGYWGTGWPSLELGNMSGVREGDEIATSGYPLKWEPISSSLPDLSKGIVSRIEEMPVGKDEWKVTKLVLDIRINPGNSGGPVFDRNGRVLGLISSERVRDPDNMPDSLKGLFNIPTGIVYCIPSPVLAREVSALKTVEVESVAKGGMLKRIKTTN